MNEQRKACREDSINPGISCLVDLPNGEAIDGVIIDISDTGARISGAPESLQVGNEYRITLVVQSYQKVAYHCIVRHIDVDSKFFGVEFMSPPKLVKGAKDKPVGASQAASDKDIKRCPVDGRVFPPDYRYCPFDKSNLVLESC